MASLIKEFKAHDGDFDMKVCNTGQHKEMLDSVLKFFGIVPDYSLNLMRPNQSLDTLSARMIRKLGDILSKDKFDYVFVQGDTTTTLCGALCAFYHQIPVIHIEAGLRSGDKYSPFPEELNRMLVSRIANIHFAPTELAKQNLCKEGIAKDVYVVGNTGIDALLLGLDLLNVQKSNIIPEIFRDIDFSNRTVLVTAHRRENFGAPLEEICLAIKGLAQEHPEVNWVFPVHLNPNVREVVFSKLSSLKNVFLTAPLDYPDMIWLMNKSYLILTDSGGIQEEAPTLGKPILVLRNVTERFEGIEAGNALLVGTDSTKITTETNLLLGNKNKYNKMAKAGNPYGTGNSSSLVANLLARLQSK